jgi:hypothetical protein
MRLYKFKYGTDMGSMMQDFYGGDATSYEVEQLSDLFSTASWIYDYYCNYAQGSLFVSDPSTYVDGVDIDNLTNAQNMLITAMSNAESAGLGLSWTMDGAGTVFTGELGIFLSPFEDISSGIYSVGIRQDGAYTLVDKSIEDCYGIRGSYNGVNVDYIVAVNKNISGMETFNSFCGAYIQLADNQGQITNKLTQEQLERLIGINTDNMDQAGSMSGVEETYFGNDIKNLFINFDDGLITASGKGTRISLDTGSNFATILTNGAIVHDLGMTGSFGSVNFNFDKGYLTYSNETLMASEHFSGTFADKDSLVNYAKYIAYNLGVDYQNIINAEGEIVLSDKQFEQILKGSFGSNPLNYQSVMIDMNFGVRLNSGKQDTAVFDYSSGLADLNLEANLTFDFTMAKIEGTNSYAPTYTLVAVNGDENGTTNVSAN